MIDEPTPLDVLEGAIQVFVNAVADEPPVILRGAVVAWEEIKVDDDGDPGHLISYAITSGTSLAATIGTLDLAKRAVLRDITHNQEDQ